MIFMKQTAAQIAAPLAMPAEALAFDDAQPVRAAVQLVENEPVALPDPITARVAVVGLGYVGLPLICGFSQNSRSIGLDIDTEKITELKNQFDRTGEVTTADLAEADALNTTDAS